MNNNIGKITKDINNIIDGINNIFQQISWEFIIIACQRASNVVFFSHIFNDINDIFIAITDILMTILITLLINDIFHNIDDIKNVTNVVK